MLFAGAEAIAKPWYCANFVNITFYIGVHLCTRAGADNFIRFEGGSTVHVSGTNSTGSSGTGKFSYDEVFDSNTSQGYIYEQAVKPIVLGVMEGFNGTVFAYG